MRRLAYALLLLLLGSGAPGAPVPAPPAALERRHVAGLTWKGMWGPRDCSFTFFGDGRYRHRVSHVPAVMAGRDFEGTWEWRGPGRLRVTEWWRGLGERGGFVSYDVKIGPGKNWRANREITGWYIGIDGAGPAPVRLWSPRKAE